MINKIAIIMGSQSDYEIMKGAAEILSYFEIPYHLEVISAHRTPEAMFEFAKKAEKSFSCIIAGAGGAAHLPGMVASLTSLPVIGVPIESKNLNGLDSLLSIVQMPKGIPVATVAINNSGNAALLAARILSLSHEEIKSKIKAYRENQIQLVEDQNQFIKNLKGTS